jgi:putative membrane protein insertion efficiency factor
MIRRTLWTAGAPLRGLLVAAIHLYRATLSGLLGGQCRFYPSCSHYAEDAIRTHGAVKGVGLATWRVLRCNPFGHGGVEHVPERVTSGQYDDLIRRPSDPRKASA